MHFSKIASPLLVKGLRLTGNRGGTTSTSVGGYSAKSSPLEPQANSLVNRLDVRVKKQVNRTHLRNHSR